MTSITFVGDPSTSPSTPIQTSMKGACFCGSVSYVLTGRPVLSAYCHCTICQRLTGCPFVHSMHFKASDFGWSHPPPHDARLDFYSIPSKPHKTRGRCKVCGATVASYNADTKCWSVWGAHLQRTADGAIEPSSWEVVKPTAHMFYATRMLDINDDLGKWDGYENRSSRIA